jgi:hypothetical protein
VKSKEVAVFMRHVPWFAVTLRLLAVCLMAASPRLSAQQALGSIEGTVRMLAALPLQKWKFRSATLEPTWNSQPLMASNNVPTSRSPPAAANGTIGFFGDLLKLPYE